MATTATITVQKDEADQIVQKHFKERDLRVRNVYVIDGDRFSYNSKTRTFALDLGPSSTPDDTTHSCFLTVALPEAPDGGKKRLYHTNSFTLINMLISKIRTQTDIPILDSILDATKAIYPHEYLLSPPTPVPFSKMLPLSQVRASGKLDQRNLMLLDLHLGKFLGQLHSGVQNDWYGLPAVRDPLDPPYNWQETFIGYFEELLDEVEKGQHGLESIQWSELRLHLSRAIGSYLFDDVDVPSLVWFTGSEEDIYITLPGTVPSLSPPTSPTSPTGVNPANLPTISAILPNVAHAIWGDPLLESWFLPPNPSRALNEGYKGGGGSPILVFARQRTKRTWYTAFLALVVLVERGTGVPADGGDSKRKWAVEFLKGCVEELKDAPTY